MPGYNRLAIIVLQIHNMDTKEAGSIGGKKNTQAQKSARLSNLAVWHLRKGHKTDNLNKALKVQDSASKG